MTLVSIESRAVGPQASSTSRGMAQTTTSGCGSLSAKTQSRSATNDTILPVRVWIFDPLNARVNLLLRQFDAELIIKSDVALKWGIEAEYVTPTYASPTDIPTETKETCSAAAVNGYAASSRSRIAYNPGISQSNDVGQLTEHGLAKFGVEGSNPSHSATQIKSIT